MPSPIGHALGGLVVHAASADPAKPLDRRRALLLAGLAAAPDLDLLLRFVDGAQHHRAESHSLGAALLAGLGVGLLAWFGRRPRAMALGVAASCAWFSHVVLDVLGSDSNPPYGVMALWPFDRGYVMSPVPVFLDIGRTLRWATVWQDAAAAAWEVAVLVPVILVVARWRQRRS